MEDPPEMRSEALLSWMVPCAAIGSKCNGALSIYRGRKLSGIRRLGVVIKTNSFSWLCQRRTPSLHVEHLPFNQIDEKT